MLSTNLNYNSQERYEFEEVLINGKIELIRINKEDYEELQEHKQLIVEHSEGMSSNLAQELKELLQSKLKATVKIIKHTADDQNTEEHYHFQILTNDKVNNQSIYKIANDFLAAQKGQEMEQVRIFDNSKKNEFSLTEEEQESLKKVNEDNYSFIKKDSKSHKIEAIEGYTREGSKNATGMGKLDRPYYILNGVSSEKAKLISRFGLGMFKNSDIEINPDNVKQALLNFYTTVGQKLATNWDKYLNIEIEQNEDYISINFNNLIILENGSIASTAKNLIEEHLANILKTSLNNKLIILENEDRLKPKEKVLAELQYLSGVEPTTEQAEPVEKVELNEVIKEQEQKQVITDLYLDFMVEIKTIKTFEELEAKKEELQEEALKVEAVRGILPVEILNEKLEQIADKQELLTIVKIERTAEKTLKEKIQEQKKSIIKVSSELKTEQELTKELTNKLNNLNDKLAETEEELLNSNAINKKLEEQAVKYRTEIKEVKAELETVITAKSKIEIELKNSNKDNKALQEEALINKENIATLKAELEAVITAKSELQKLQDTTVKELKEEKIKSEKYTKLYNKEVEKLKTVLMELEAVKQKLAEKETENKTLNGKVKNFVQEVLNLKGANSNLEAHKKALEEEKEELNTSLQDTKQLLITANAGQEKAETELTTGKEEAKNYIAQLLAAHEQEKSKAKNYVAELLLEIEELKKQNASKGKKQHKAPGEE